MKNDHFNGPIREENPCRKCTDSRHRPTCRRECEKDAAWHKELERVNGNRRKYQQRRSVRRGNKN